MKCELVNANIAKRIGYNSGNPTVTDEGQLVELKSKLKLSDMYSIPSSKPLPFDKRYKHDSDIFVGDIDNGTTRYLLSVEAYFNDTYYFDGAVFLFKDYYYEDNDIGQTVRPRGLVFTQDENSSTYNAPTKLKLVVNNTVGREFTNTNIAPLAFHVDNYPNMYVSDFRQIYMPNTDLEIELKGGTVMHMGNYADNKQNSQIPANICADNLTVRGSGVMLATTFNYGYDRHTDTCRVINANSFTVNGSGIVIDFKKSDSTDKFCINVPTPSDFKPINAKKIRLYNAMTACIAGVPGTEESYKKYYGNYWDIFDIKYRGETPTEVIFGRSEAVVSEPTLSLGGTDYQKNETVPDYILGSGDNKFSVKFTVTPQWYKMLVLQNQVKSNASIEVWKDGVNQGQLAVTEQFNTSYDGKIIYTLAVPSLKLEAGHIYSVYGYMNPYSGSIHLADSKAAKWTFYVRNKNDNSVIPQVSLLQDVDLRPDKPTGFFNNNRISLRTDTKCFIDTQTVWDGEMYNGSYPIAGKTYQKTVTLTARDNYRFAKFCDVTIDTPNTEVVHAETSSDRKTLTIYLEATCVKLFQTATATLQGFYLGVNAGSSAVKVVSKEPEKYDVKLAFVAEYLSNGTVLEDAYIFEKNSSYVFGLEIEPKPGYGFGNGVMKSVKLEVNASKDDGGAKTIDTEYKTGVEIDGYYYAGEFYLTNLAACAPAQSFDRLDITVNEPIAGKSAVDSSYTTADTVQDDFKVTEFYWMTRNNGKYTDAFKAGEEYYYFITVECPWYIEPNNDYIYVNGVNCYAYYYEKDGKNYIDAYDTLVAGSIPATGIKLNKNTTTLYVGNTETLSAEVEPIDSSDDVIWKSDNTKVATVDAGGKVTAIAEGTATVTATAGDKSASCVVKVEKPTCTHTNKTPVSAKAATCTEKGNKDYYKCNDCNRFFNDTACKSEITDKNSVVIAALGHDYSEKIADNAHKKDTAGDCRSKDTYWYDCSRCNMNAKDDSAAKDKWYRSDNAGPHSYDNSNWGYRDADGHAHKCRYDNTHDTPSAHTPGAPATESTAQVCTECGYVITPALNHNHKMTKINAKQATCTEDGNIEYYRCDDCGKRFADISGKSELTENKIIVAATGHDFEWIIDKTATSTENGLKHEECKVCKYKKEAIEIPATGSDKPSTDDRLEFADGVSIDGNINEEAKKVYIIPAKSSGMSVDEFKALFKGSVNIIGDNVERVYNGMTFMLGENKYTLILKGDVNGDGKITTKDARAILRISARLDIPDDNAREAADVDSNGKVTVKEARIVLRFAARLQNTLLG